MRCVLTQQKWFIFIQVGLSNYNCWCLWICIASFTVMEEFGYWYHDHPKLPWLLLIISLKEKQCCFFASHCLERLQGLLILFTQLN